MTLSTNTASDRRPSQPAATPLASILSTLTLAGVCVDCDVCRLCLGGAGKGGGSEDEQGGLNLSLPWCWLEFVCDADVSVVYTW